MGADKLAENTQNLSAQAQKFGILMKKGFIGRPYSVLHTEIKLSLFPFKHLT